LKTKQNKTKQAARSGCQAAGLSSCKQCSCRRIQSTKNAHAPILHKTRNRQYTGLMTMGKHACALCYADNSDCQTTERMLLNPKPCPASHTHSTRALLSVATCKQQTRN
jgi:hypothetical protein